MIVGVPCRFRICAYNNGGWGVHSEASDWVTPGSESTSTFKVVSMGVQRSRLAKGGPLTILDRLEAHPLNREEQLWGLSRLRSMAQVYIYGYRYIYKYIYIYIYIYRCVYIHVYRDNYIHNHALTYIHIYSQTFKYEHSAQVAGGYKKGNLQRKAALAGLHGIKIFPVDPEMGGIVFGLLGWTLKGTVSLIFCLCRVHEI
jgi:hypothetical protein